MAYIPKAHHFYDHVSDDAVQAELAKVYDDYGWLPDDERLKRAKSRALIKAVLAHRERRDDDMQLTAIHEAGHCVMAWQCFGAKSVEYASIDRSTGRGETRVLARRHDHHSQMAVDCAGFAAEQHYTGQRPDLATTRYDDDVLSFAKTLKRRGDRHDLYTRAFLSAADAVREEFFSLPKVWKTVLTAAAMILEAPDGKVVWCPEFEAERQHDDRIKSMLTEQASGFDRLLKSNADFWRESGLL